MDARLRTIMRPPQFERFRQLRFQHDAGPIVGRPEFADALGLTAEQRRKLDRMMGRPFDFGGDAPMAAPRDGTPPPPDGSARPPMGGAGAPPISPAS